MRNQFAAAEAPFSFFDAFDGRKIRLTDHFSHLDTATWRLHTYREPLPGEIGCFASHLALWKHAVCNDEPVVVLEDDCQLDAAFSLALDAVRRTIRSLGFVRLESFERRNRLRITAPAHRVGRIDRFGLHYLCDVPLCLLGYAVSPGAAARLIAASEVLSSPVDKLVQRTWEHGVPIFALSPGPVAPSARAGMSTIGSRTKRRDLTTMLKRAGYKGIGEIRRAIFNHAQLERWRETMATESGDWDFRAEFRDSDPNSAAAAAKVGELGG